MQGTIAARANLTLSIATAILGMLGARSVWAEPAAPSSLTFEIVRDLGSNMGTGYRPTLTVGRDGNIYGTTLVTAFRIDAAGTFATVHTFSEGPPARLVVGQDGFLYGFTGQTPYSDGVPWAYHGVFFRLDYQQTYTVLLTLPKSIATELVVGSDGAFYAGSAYESWGKTSWNDTGLIKLTSAGAFSALGGNEGIYSPVPELVGSDGAIYGTRYSWYGGIFRLDTTGDFTVIHDFTEAEGFLGGFGLGSDGLIYATSEIAGSAQAGAVFRFDNTGNVTLLHELSAATDGAYPASSLVLGSDGAMYGVATSGGTGGGGTVFKMDTSGNFTPLHAFNWSNGGYPERSLLLAKDGALYGVTTAGSPNPAAFRIDSSGTATYPVMPSNLTPVSALVQGSDCALYGTADYYASGNFKTIVYRLFEPGHLCQRIEFDPLPDRVVDDLPFTVTAAASSALPVSFTASGSCTVNSDQVTLIDVGLCTLTASQVGDERFGPADDVSQVFTVPEPEQVVSLSAGFLLLHVLARRRVAPARGLSLY